MDQERLIADLAAAEGQADANGRKILAMGRIMTVENREIVRGSCWDYSNTVYNRSGYPNTKTSRQTIFKGTKKQGPFADPKLIRPGDWLYYVNHSYGGIEHSAIFVKWLDYKERTALMLSYAGEKRKDPARYLPYDLSHVYQITRPGEEGVMAAAGNNVKSAKFPARKKRSAPLPPTAPVEAIASAAQPAPKPVTIQEAAMGNPSSILSEAVTSPVENAPVSVTSPLKVDNAPPTQPAGTGNADTTSDGITNDTAAQ